MSRVYKSRFWDAEEKEFVTDWMASNGDQIAVDQGKELIFVADDDRFIRSDFIGLLDKNERPIFDGDIVRAHCFYFNGNEAEYEFTGQVMYSDWCSYGIQDLKPRIEGHGWFEICDTSHFEEPCIEVIGNIWQDLTPANETGE